MVLKAPNTTTQLFDIRTGRITRQFSLFIQQLLDSIGIIGNVVGTTDTQTLTNKTIDGDLNTLSDIATSSLKTRSGSDGTVITGTSGVDGNIVQWDGNGDVTDTGIGSSVVVTDGSFQSVVQLQTYTVATLPSGATGKVSYASDARVFDGVGVQEGAGVGTGGVVSHNGTNWVLIGTNTTAIA